MNTEMSETQFEILVEHILKNGKYFTTTNMDKASQRIEAVRLHFFEGMTYYSAEKAVYGRSTNTCGRDCKFFTANYEAALRIASAE